MQLPYINFDCKHFLGDRPCSPNKEYGVFCENCEFYERDKTITDEFPSINIYNENEETEKFKKIIIIKLDAVGDVLRTTSILPTLKKKYADSSITWITKEKSYGVLKDNELIDEIYFDTDELDHIYNDVFDIAINLDSGKESCLIMNYIQAVTKFGYTLINGKPYPINSLANEWYLMGVNDNVKRKNKKTYHQIIHEISNLEYNNEPPYIGISKEKMEHAENIRNQLGLNKFKDLILINLGGGNRWQYKKWTKEGYIELIKGLSELCSYSAIGIIAGDEDRDFYNEISGKITNRNNVIRLGCDNSIDDFICIVYLSDKIFTSDSLAFHIATGLDKYVVAVVGPTSHTELDVFGNGKIIYSEDVDCLCCYLNKCDKTVTCMNTLKAQDILKNLI